MYVSIGYPSGQGATLIADTGAGKQKLGVLPAWKTGTVVTLRLNNWEKGKFKCKIQCNSKSETEGSCCVFQSISDIITSHLMI